MASSDLSQPRLSAHFDEAKIDAIFWQLNQCHLPGVAVGIAVEGQSLYRKGFGLASMEQPLALSSSTRLRICSSTKHFTALAYLLLCEEGRAGLDDPIEKHLPEIHRANYGVTMRELMGNVSGLRDVHGICWQLSGMEAKASSEDLLSLYRTIDDVNSGPRTAYCYNNGGFLLLSAAIERIADQPLEELFRQRIFYPLGMYDSLLRRSDRNFVAHSATSHMTGPKGEFYRYLVGSDVAGEGGIVSTVDDMLRWLAHMQAPHIGTQETWRLLKTPQTLRNGTSTGYGMGLTVGRYRGVETLSHPGGWMGSNAQMIKVPAAGLDLIVLVNRHDVASSLLANEILDACLPNLEPTHSTTKHPPSTGIFRCEATGRIIELKVQGGEQIVSLDGMDIAVHLGPDGGLHPVGLMAFLKQSFLPVGDWDRPAAIRMNDYGNIEMCPAIPRTSDGVGEHIVGRYRSPGTNTNLNVTDEGGVLRMHAAGHFGAVDYELRPLARHTWQLTSPANAALWGGTLSSGADQREIRLSNWSNWGLPFRRIS